MSAFLLVKDELGLPPAQTKIDCDMSMTFHPALTRINLAGTRESRVFTGSHSVYEVSRSAFCTF